MTFFEILAILFTSHCPCLLGDTQEESGPFYLGSVSLSTDKQDPTYGVNV